MLKTFLTVCHLTHVCRFQERCMVCSGPSHWCQGSNPQYGWISEGLPLLQWKHHLYWTHRYIGHGEKTNHIAGFSLVGKILKKSGIRVQFFKALKRQGQERLGNGSISQGKVGNFMLAKVWEITQNSFIQKIRYFKWFYINVRRFHTKQNFIKIGREYSSKYQEKVRNLILANVWEPWILLAKFKTEWKNFKISAR